MREYAPNRFKNIITPEHEAMVLENFVNEIAENKWKNINIRKQGKQRIVICKSRKIVFFMLPFLILFF